MRRGFSLIVLLALLFAWSSALAEGVPVDQADPAQRLAARKEFGKGMRAFGAGRFDEALTGFRASYDTVASPNSHLMIGKALIALGRNAEAYREMKATVVEAEAAAASSPKYKRALDSSRVLAAELRDKIGLVTVRVDGGTTIPPGSVTVAGEVMEDIAEPVVVEPGSVTVSLKLDQHSDQQVVEVAPGAEVAVDFDLPKEPEPEPKEREPAQPGFKRTVAFVAGGIAAWGFINFAIFGALTMSTYGDLDELCPAGACTAEQQDDIDAGRTYQTLANAGVIVGVTGLIIGTAMFLIDLQEQDEAGDSAQIYIGPASIGVSGRF